MALLWFHTLFKILFWTRSKGWFIRILRRIYINGWVRWVLLPWCLHSTHQAISTLLETKQPFLPSQKWQLFGKWGCFRATSHCLVGESPHVFCGSNARPRGVTVMVPTWRRTKGKGDRFRWWRFFWNFLISKIYVKSQGFRWKKLEL